jgi:hypothetical protein
MPGMLRMMALTPRVHKPEDNIEDPEADHKRQLEWERKRRREKV